MKKQNKLLLMGSSLLVILSACSNERPKLNIDLSSSNGVFRSIKVPREAPNTFTPNQEAPKEGVPSKKEKKKKVRFSVPAKTGQAFQNYLTNGNTQINIGSAVSVQVGNLINTADGLIINNGQINIQGTALKNKSIDTYTGQGQIEFSGTKEQEIVGDLIVSTLNVNNGGILILDAASIEVLEKLDLSDNGNIELNETVLKIHPVAQITGYSPNHYIHTNGSGNLSQSVGTKQKVIFPIGTDSYAPATLIDASEQAVYMLRVEKKDKYDEVQETLIDWDIREENFGGALAEVIFEWNEEQTTTSFDPNNCAIINKEAAELPLYSNATKAKSSSYSMNKKNVNTLGTFTLKSTGETAALAVSIYPNPVVHQLNVQVTGLEEETEVELFIYSVTGAEAYRSVASLSADQILTIDAVNDLVPGTYMLSINSSTNNESLYTGKFTKK
jgi:hypothetical protein